MELFIKNVFSWDDQTRRKLWIWSHRLKKYLTQNFIFCATIPTGWDWENFKTFSYHCHEQITNVMNMRTETWLKRFCLYRFLHITIDLVIYFLKSLHDLLIYVKCVICQNFQSASRSIINFFVFKPTFLCYHL